ncbi:MAG: hypothetical protein L0I76_37490, partial [Pseudonocardia sp.]|nr:hypothetical protein [Pseudonocardia sp.]
GGAVVIGDLASGLFEDRIGRGPGRGEDLSGLVTGPISPFARSDRLAQAQRRYRELAAQLADIGLIASGSVLHRYTRCGNTGCRCHADPPQRHGPYYQWTAKVDGKTSTRRLTAGEAALYQQWITNDRQLREVVNEMREVAAEASEIIINQEREGDRGG